MLEFYKAYYDWWFAFWATHPLLFLVVAGAAIALNLVLSRRSR
ncbi:hypothetical protein [Mesorhizobium sp.]|nr:hypothetical protein [Mesorhizobium sp.]